MTQKTISAWIYPQSYGNEGAARIVDKEYIMAEVPFDGGWLFAIYNNDFGSNTLIYLHHSNDGDDYICRWVGSANSITLNTWQHVAMTYDSGSSSNTPSLYVNGQPLSVSVSSACGATLTNDDAPANITIGNRENGGAWDRAFDGMIDDLAIWNRTLEASEIQDIYDLQAGRHYWHANATDGTSSADSETWWFYFGEITAPFAMALSRPVNAVIDYFGDIFFECIAAAGNEGGSTELLNVSLYTNTTGEWRANQTIYPGELHPDRSGNLTEGLVMLLHMNNDSLMGQNDTFAYDWSGWGNNATAYINASSTLWIGPNATGKFGDAYDLFGDGDYMKVWNSNSLRNPTPANPQYSVSLWAKFKDRPPGNRYYTLLMKAEGGDGNGWYLDLNATHLRLWLDNNSQMRPEQTGSIYYSWVPSLNTWKNIAFTIQGANAKIYIDGSMVQESTNAKFNDTNNNIYIGMEDADTSDAFNWDALNATIDEIAIWNRTLSAGEIAQVYAATKTTYTANFTILGLPDGSYDWNCESWDDYGGGSSSQESSNWTFTVERPTLYCAEGCTFVRNSTDDNVSIFTSNGHLYTAGNLAMSVGVPDGSDFIFMNSTNDTVAWINNINGTISLAGQVFNGSGTECTPQGKSFIVKDRNENCVAYINETGDLWLKGLLMTGQSI